MVTDPLFDDLLEFERYFFDSNLAIAVVHLQFTLCVLHGRKHVLVELCLESGRALGAAHPGLDLRRLLDRGLLLHLLSPLTYSHDCLVFHLHIIITAHQLGLDEVLDLGRGLGPLLLVLEHEA